MDSSEKYSKKQLKELRKLAELEKEKVQTKQNTFKWIAIGVSSVIFLVLFVGMIVLAKQQKKNEENKPVIISNSGWFRGTESARLTLSEFSDFQCPACRAYLDPVKQVLSVYPKDLRLQYKHFPLTNIHKNAFSAAVAAEAAGKQGKFWEMHDMLFEKQDEWSELANPGEKFLEYALTLGVDKEQFVKDYNDKSLEEKVKEMQNEGIALGVNSTPTFFLNGKKVDKNPGTLEDFKKLIDEALKN